MKNDLQRRFEGATPIATFNSDSVHGRAARRHVRKRITAATVALGIAVLGIGGLLVAFADGDSVQPAATIDGAIHQRRLPISSVVHWDLKEQRVVGEASELLTSRCLSDAGFDVPRDPTAKSSPWDDRRYGIQDMGAARRWGYGLPPSQIVDDSASTRYIASLSPERSRAYEIAALGTPAEQIPVGSGGSTMPAGCFGAMYDAIFGSRAEMVRAEELRELAEALENESFTSSESDPRVEAAIATWGSCMSEDRFDVDSFDDAALLAPLGSEASIDIAVADVRCKDATDLVELWSGVEAEIQARLLSENREAIDELVALRQQAVDNAEGIVAENRDR